MENKNIIVILVVIIVILAVAIGVVLLNPTHAKESTKIKITSNKTQYEGGELSIQLTDSNKTPISKELVNITITNSSGDVVVGDVVKTDSKGKAKMDLDLKKGKYNVTVCFSGNENYTGNNTTQKLTIKKEAQESSSDNSVDMSLYSSYSSAVGNYRIVERHQELGLIETSSGNYYVMAGDGIYYYNGHDSKGNILFGSRVR